MRYPWGSDNPYNDYAGQLRRTWGGRVQKISVDAGFDCPNRDGSLGTAGCAWCDGSSFVPAYCGQRAGVAEQVRSGIDFFSHKYIGQKYLVFFQAYSGTYAEPQRLRELYRQALDVEGVVGLVVGTRPDLLSAGVVAVLAEMAARVPVTVEIGVESTLDRTLESLGRGHGFAASADAALRLRAAGLAVGAHLILGLPGENRAELLGHAERLNGLPIDQLKIHHLQILRGTPLERRYAERPDEFRLFGADEYVALLDDFVCGLRPDIAVERLCNEAPEERIVAPRWNGVKNYAVAQRLAARLRAAGRWQGCRLAAGAPA